MTSDEIKKLAARFRDGDDGASARSMFRKIFMLHAQETGLGQWITDSSGMIKDEYHILRLSGHWVEKILTLNAPRFKDYSEFFIDFGVHISMYNEIAIYSQVANEEEEVDVISDIYNRMMALISQLEKQNKWRSIYEPFEATQI